MKLSNKILIILFGTILAYTLMAFGEIRIKGDRRDLREANAIAETSSLTGIQYLVVGPNLDQQITISSSDEPKLEMKSKSGQLLSKLDFELKNDTLFLNSMEEVEERFLISIQLPKNGFKGMKVTSGYTELNAINQSELTIMLTGGRLETLDNVRLERMNVSFSAKANGTINSRFIDTVMVNLNNSTLRINEGSIIKGSIENEAGLYADEAREIQLKRDKNSRMQVY